MVMTQIELFLELADPNEMGLSKRIYATDFVGKYSKLRSGNGYKWPENLPHTFIRGGRGDKWYIELTGKRDNLSQRPIRSDIRESLLSGEPKCAHSNSGSLSSDKLVIDHRNGRYNDPRVLDKKTQNEGDFQVLSNRFNLMKRSDCDNCEVTGLRFDAKKLGFSKSVCSGKLEYEGTCVGCYWYGPKEFRACL
jgi:hypothetical protein